MKIPGCEYEPKVLVAGLLELLKWETGPKSRQCIIEAITTIEYLIREYVDGYN